LEVVVLDESLSNYGIEPNDILQVQVGLPKAPYIEVWELDGDLHARHLQSTGAGWMQAFTYFLTAGKICYSIDSEKAKKITKVGWLKTPIECPRRAVEPIL
jgi:hypothetical protein